MDKDTRLWNARLEKEKADDILSGIDQAVITDAVRQLNGRPIRTEGQDIVAGYGTLEFRYLQNGRFLVSLSSDRLGNPSRPLRALIVQDANDPINFEIKNIDYWIPGVDFPQSQYDNDFALLRTMIRLHAAIEAETSVLRERRYSPDRGGTNHASNKKGAYSPDKKGNAPKIKRDPDYIPRGHRRKCEYLVYVRGTICVSRKTGKTWYRKPHLRVEVPNPINYGAPDWYFDDLEQDNENA